ncbi:DUF6483 family protein [Paenibacillus cremeus]|uniref:Uncharacterized protein n=1 Tax=Paenibacillus cremeus TaxID=2163881 RepID=A0A559K496_9BACL|nr:DUF6483 family protein [Paenibacillus cremeus]TVY06954.1 hypothetical protein FPZ49_26320 [Paenibacillus cremeus]
MYRRDYLLRLIEQSMAVVQKVMYEVSQRRLEEAMALLTQAMKQLLGVGSKLVHALAVKDLIALLSRDGEVDQGKVLALGDLLNAEAAVWKEAGQEVAARQAATKSAELLLTARELDARAELKDEFQSRVQTALEMIGRSRMEIGLMEKLISYYEETGWFASSEDVLFHLLDALEEAGLESERMEWVEIGIQMYERWLLLDEGKLENGNFSSNEVETALQELKNQKHLTGN